MICISTWIRLIGKLLFFGEVVIAALAVIICIVGIKLADAFLAEPFRTIAVGIGTLIGFLVYGLMRYLFYGKT